jgi:stage II sporulation protein AA (anti-sigma F factor antagonist)
MRDSLMKFELRQAKPNCVLVTCQGGLSWEDREALAEGVEQYLDGHGDVTGVIMDLADVTFINSAGLGALFQLCQRLRAREAVPVFVNASPKLKRLFQTVGLHEFARIDDDVKAVLDSFNTSGDPPPSPRACAGEQLWGQAPPAL